MTKRVQDHLVVSDGTRLHWQGDLPDDPTASVLLLHGLGEHKGRYDHVISALNEAGFAVFSIDHRGHGLSQGPRAVVGAYDEFMDDIRSFYTEIVAAATGDRDLVLLGHSMGGNLALGYALRYQDDVDALALSAPLLVPGSDVNAISKAVVGLLARVSPRIPVQRLDATAISRDPQVVAAYEADPLVYRGKVSAGLGAALLGEMESFPARYAELTLPILIMHGTADRLTDPDGSRQLADTATQATVTTHFYDDNFHEIFNEPDRDIALADLVRWLSSVVGKDSVG